MHFQNSELGLCFHLRHNPESCRLHASECCSCLLKLVMSLISNWYKVYVKGCACVSAVSLHGTNATCADLCGMEECLIHFNLIPS